MDLENTMRFSRYAILGLVAVVILAGCSRDRSSVDEEDVIAATPSAITIKSSRLSEPIEAAQAHCAKHGRKAVSARRGAAWQSHDQRDVGF